MIDPRDVCRELGFDLVGVSPVQNSVSIHAYRRWLDAGFAGSMDYLHRHADLRGNPAGLLPGAQSVIAVGLNYYQNVEHLPEQTRVARYALGRDYHKVIRSKLRKLVRALEAERGGKHRICVDSAPLPEREIAHRAGLGWFGKNTMLINSKRGSWFLLGFVISTLEIEPDKPALGGCGTCSACIDACSTGAIVELDGRWQVDARSCISYLTIEHPEEADERVGHWTFGCDICQEVCPFNQPRNSQPLRAQVTDEPDFLTRTALVDVPLARVLTLTRDEWEKATQGSPIRRAGFNGLRRVAEINQKF